jgi:hypothetical protein
MSYNKMRCMIVIELFLKQQSTRAFASFCFDISKPFKKSFFGIFKTSHSINSDSFLF